MIRTVCRIRALAAGFLVACLAMTPASAETTASQDASLFSTSGLAALEDLMHAAVRDGRAPSAIAMLACEDEILWLRTAGEMGPGVPMRDDAIIPLASVGKMYTATAAMMLIERGRISLDDPVSKFIPEFAGVRLAETTAEGETRLVPAVRPITIRHLLTHTSGLTVSGDSFWAAWDAHSEKTTATGLARALAALPLVSQPGERFQYGPTGAAYEVLGAVIEIAGGQTLEEFMIENIFRPLALNDTFFYLPPEKAPRLPAFYRNVDGVVKPDRAQGEDFPRSTYFHGGGGVQSSARDILRFARMFLDGGTVDGVRLLGKESVRQMMSDQLGDKAPQGYSWGYGAAVQMTPTGEAAQYGWTGGGYATLWIDPAAQLVAYFAFPVMPPGDNDLLREFRRLVYAALASPDPVSAN